MKTPRKYIVATLVLMLFSSSVYADGNKLLEQCISTERYIDTGEIKNEFDIGMCLGLVQGVRNTMQIMGSDSSTKVCFPDNGIDNGQATRIVVAYLKKNPASLHEHEVLLTMLAFADAYPCK